MNDIQIFEQEIKNSDKKVGKIAILRGGLNSDNPTQIMNKAVSDYVGRKGHNQFVEIHLDNPWVRVVLDGINELDYKDFVDQRL
ncbi:hypothetical protein BZARG_1000 [Bizionia argentinensis JUB59]|uniref:Uncharacterized protein n=1 Tax=Bizionia argentinensis JUB59 TaxID=1046627 RepID=G2EBX1_9FLAO|nr:hypothetical protein [Bizionia argentinensis]EGV44226.1 hypothetical protein BZARG_1000 [Bizionia argentinensis JUB59]